MRAYAVLAAGLGGLFIGSAVQAAAAASTTCDRGGWLHDKADDGFAPTPAFAQQTRAPAPAGSSRYEVEVVATGFNRPFGLAFLSDGRLLVSDRPGRLRIVAADGTVFAPIIGVPPISAEGPQRFDLVLDPQFARNRLLYFNYFVRSPHSPAGLKYDQWLRLPQTQRAAQPFGFQRIARAQLSRDGRRLENLHVIYEGGLPGRLAIGTDGDLYFTSAPPLGGFDLPADDEPQRLSNVYGKVSRIHRDGSIPKDNPFVGRPGVRPELYSYGMRDAVGATIDPRTGALWTSENGPRGGDEINRHRPGANLGYPLISYGREYSGALIGNGMTARDDLQQPVYFWTPSIAPSGLAFYDGTLFPEWRGNLFVAAMAGKKLVRLVLEGEHVVAEEALLMERCERIRTVRVGVDGALYLLTDETEGKVLRVVPPR